MRLNELRDNPGARKSRRRVGRGIGSGLGKTSGHGHKGQKARTGVAIKGFEGGQMPLQRRLPKRGFVQPKAPFCVVNLGNIQRALEAKTLDATKPLTPESFEQAGLIRNAAWSLRILAKGTLKTKVEVVAHHVSEAARQAIEKVGGAVTLVDASSKD